MSRIKQKYALPKMQRQTVTATEVLTAAKRQISLLLSRKGGLLRTDSKRPVRDYFGRPTYQRLSDVELNYLASYLDGKERRLVERFAETRDWGRAGRRLGYKAHSARLALKRVLLKAIGIAMACSSATEGTAPHAFSLFRVAYSKLPKPRRQRKRVAVKRDADALERRRLEGAKLLKEGVNHSQIARTLGVSRQAVINWKRALKSHLSLTRKPFGRRPELSAGGVT